MLDLILIYTTSESTSQGDKRGNSGVDGLLLGCLICNVLHEFWMHKKGVCSHG